MNSRVYNLEQAGSRRFLHGMSSSLMVGSDHTSLYFFALPKKVTKNARPENHLEQIYFFFRMICLLPHHSLLLPISFSFIFPVLIFPSSHLLCFLTRMYLPIFFRFCHTSSFSQGNGWLVQRWGLVFSMILSERRLSRARSMICEVLFTEILNPEATLSRTLAPALFHRLLVSVR